MKGKAVMLLANRSLSALIVVSVVMSAFAGVLVLTNPGPAKAQAIGDLIVTSGTYTIEGILQPVDGDVLVGSGGTLIVRDGTLSVISNYNQRHTVTVNGGELILDHGTITTYLDQIEPWPFLTLTVMNGGKLTTSNNSVLQFPGNFVATGDASDVVMYDTIITALSPDQVNQYVIGGAGSITADSANDGPAISVTDADVTMFDSSILSLPEFPSDADMATNLSLAGSASLLAVGCYIDVDFGPTGIASDWYTHNVLTLGGLSRAYLYGCTFAEYSGANAARAPAVVATGSSTSPALPLTKGPGDNTGDSLSSLAAVDGLTYQVLQSETMEIETWDVSGMADGLALSSASIVVTYTAAANYQGNQAIRWAREGGGYASTGIIPLNTDPALTTRTFDLPLTTIQTVGDVRNLDLIFGNNGPPGSGAVEFDSVWVLFTVGSDAFVYRWLNVTVGDEYGVPISGASITARFTGATELEGHEAIYYSPQGVGLTPPNDVLDYLGQSSTSYRVTNSDGVAVIPYLTDVITNGASGSPLYLGTYALTGSARIGVTDYSSTSTYSFPAYPAMSATDQTFDVTVKLEGASAQSPNTARWLVVPPDLTIADMSYYHAGDVIVAADGMLTLESAVFQLIQSSPNQRVVYVDGTVSAPGVLHVNDSLVTSSLPIDIIVQGYGMLVVENSTLAGVNVVALENSRVVFKNVQMNGVLQTDFQSAATIEVYDSELTNTPIIAGDSWAGFTETSAPSVTVQDDATAIIYRWIQVTVFDGAGYPAPGVNVSAKYFISGELASWANTDGQGVARVNSMGTIITSAGSTFVGNYKVSAKLTAWNAVEYLSDDELSIGVMPYTQPLTKNTTYALLHISSALPDLTLGADPIQFNPGNPRNNEATYINVTVGNIGAVAAHNVVARYTDLTDNAGIGDATAPVIEAGLSGVISLMWTANPPLDVDGAHMIQVEVDPFDPANPDSDVPELVETQLIATKEVYVQSLPDLYVGGEDYDIYTFPTDVVINTQATIAARIYNIGDEASGQVDVAFYDRPAGLGEVLIGSTVLESVPAGSYVVASLPWTPTINSTHTIRVVATHLGTAPEISTTNNEGSNFITVLDPPDVLIQSVVFTPLTGEIPGGDTLTVTVTLRNDQPAPISGVEVTLYLGGETSPNWSALLDSDVVTTTLARGGTGVGVMYWETPEVTVNTAVRLWIMANWDGNPVEQSVANNLAFRDLTIKDMRPDMAISSQDIKVFYGATEVQSSVFGRKVTIVAQVENFGGQPAYGFNVTLGLKNSTGWTTTLSDKLYDISADLLNRSTNVTFEWTIALETTGLYQIWCSIDPANAVSEQNEDNNYAEADFTVDMLVVKISATTDSKEYDAGDEMIIVVTIRDETTNAVVPNVPLVRVWLARSTDVNNDVVEGTLEEAVGNATGKATVRLTIPLEIDTSDYRVVVEVFDQEKATSATVAISAQVEEPWLPMWMLLLIIVGIVGSVVGVTIYTYKYGLGKYVECGECGAFIPASNKRCPKCGVEFEAGTMKCSECGAWIPAESSECPNCGVKFVGEVVEEGDYLERMRKQYDEQVVSRYREFAKPELGKKFSEDQFEAWFKRQPGYISFDDWLAKEEEKKKEGPIACPVCGTLNPKEATVCHKCGTVFAGAQEAPPTVRRGPPPSAPPSGPTAGTGLPTTTEELKESVRQAPSQMTQALQAAMPVAPKMVIRRPIDRKVVPKKIIKTPTGEEKVEDSGGGDEEQQ